MKLLVVDGRFVDESDWTPAFAMVTLREEPIYDDAEEEMELCLKRFPTMCLFGGGGDDASSMSFM